MNDLCWNIEIPETTTKNLERKWNKTEKVKKWFARRRIITKNNKE